MMGGKTIWGKQIEMSQQMIWLQICNKNDLAGHLKKTEMSSQMIWLEIQDKKRVDKRTDRQTNKQTNRQTV